MFSSLFTQHIRSFFTTALQKVKSNPDVAANPNHLVSWGTFFASKPFYEMCCCKLHLHARWVVSALLTTCKQQKIELEAELESESNTYISWNCASDKKKSCVHVEDRWENLKQLITTKADP